MGTNWIPWLVRYIYISNTCVYVLYYISVYIDLVYSTRYVYSILCLSPFRCRSEYNTDQSVFTSPKGYLRTKIWYSYY